MSFDMVSEIRRAQGVGTPLIAINTLDQPTTMKTVGSKADAIVLGWNMLNGIRPFSDSEPTKKLVLTYLAYAKADEQKFLDSDDTLESIKQPVEMLGHALEINKFLALLKDTEEKERLAAKKSGSKVPIPYWDQDLIIMVCNAHKWLNETPYMQGIMNIRDAFKANTSVLLLLGPNFVVPPEYPQDIHIIDEPLPTKEEIKSSAKILLTDNEVDAPDSLLNDAADALIGLAAFPIEQALSLSVKRNPTDKKKFYVDKDILWERKRRMIQAIPGLQMGLYSETFDEIGGLEAAKSFVTDLANGPCRPVLIVYIDEIDKMVAGAGFGGMGESSGTSQDQMQQILTNMAECDYFGQLNLGPAGCGKSLFAQSMASTFGMPIVKADFGAAKDGVLGSSEQRIRTVFKTIYAMAGKGGAYFIATCNRLNSLSPELQRRFNFGMFYFDLCSVEERVSIGKIMTTKKYPTVKDNPDFWRSAKGWSGANIRDCCKMAYAFNIPVEQAAKRVIPAAKRDADGIKQLRLMAHDKFSSASYEGTYDMNRSLEDEEIVTSVGRKFNTDRI